MKINFTWPDHLIPMVAPLGGDQFMVDLFINSILLENDEVIPRRFTRMILDLLNDDKPLWRMEIPLPALMSHLAVDSELNTLSEEKKRNYVGEHLADRMDRIQTDPVFQPGSRGLLRRFPIRFLATSIPDTLIARAFSGPHLIGRAEIAVRPFSNKRAYHFPVSGAWQVINNFDYTLGHRAYAGQEFAMDFVQLGSDGLLRKGLSNDPSDYYCFGAEVEAMHDGVVVHIESRIPDNSAGCNSNGKAFQKRVDKYGYTSGRSGNHIIIRHDEDRFSFYAHLKTNSIDLKPGDEVRRGQRIALVGNSGHCSHAHLHIQLNEGENPLGHRGLPMSFDNLFDFFGQPLPFITHNNLLVHRAVKDR
ncbi:M23 family metallopeptidase [bacterium]|nr:M23 family metallopeptidase [candidate division CSSED10-310 bacterium]